MGLMEIFTSDKMRAKTAMPAHAAPPPMKVNPGTSHTAAATATAVTIQRMMKLIASPFSTGFLFGTILKKRAAPRRHWQTVVTKALLR